MAIQISNFEVVWKYYQKTNFPALSQEQTPKYYDGTYIFVTCSIESSKHIRITATLYDKKPEITMVEGSDTPIHNNARVIDSLYIDNMETDVEGNILLMAHEYLVSYLTEINPKVKFEIVGLKEE